VVPSRRTFRVFANSASVRFVALFADYGAVELRKPRLTVQPPSMRPTDRSVDMAIRQAHAETVVGGGDDTRRLEVVLLHAEKVDTKLTVGIDARFFIDHLRLNRERAKLVNCDLWHVCELHIDVLAHIDVPVHRLATKDECARFDAEDLPLMLLDDPVRRWHGFLIDDVVAIEFNDADVGRRLQLRRVVERPGPSLKRRVAPIS